MPKPRLFQHNGHTIYGVPSNACGVLLFLNGGYVECEETGKHTLHSAPFGNERINWSIV